MVTTRAEREVERQKKLVSVAEKSKSRALNDILRLRRRVAVLGTHQAKLLSTGSAAST